MNIDLFSRTGTRYTAPEGTKAITVNRKCVRCGGAGGSDRWAFTGWTCYRCAGNGIDPNPETVKLYTAEQNAKLDAAALKRNAKKEAAALEKLAAEQAAAAAKQEAFAAANGDVLAWLKANAENSFAASLLDSLKWNGALSARQIEVVRERIVKDAERKAVAAGSTFVGAVKDRREFTATVQNVLLCEPGQYGVLAITTLVDTEGHILVVKSTSWRAEKGEVLTFKASVKGHTEFRGAKQTVLERVKVLEAA